MHPTIEDRPVIITITGQPRLVSDQSWFPNGLMWLAACGHPVTETEKDLYIAGKFRLCPAMEEDCTLQVEDSASAFLPVHVSSAACNGCHHLPTRRWYCRTHQRADYCEACGTPSADSICAMANGCSHEPVLITMHVCAQWEAPFMLSDLALSLPEPANDCSEEQQPCAMTLPLRLGNGKP